mmetsp:Transcript_12940/g.29400  ORF Transcript_12940/g.29400 Transcript_12940/m.29400 type:complete len:216 (+) Transcript_12940:654-1301(+)
MCCASTRTWTPTGATRSTATALFFSGPAPWDFARLRPCCLRGRPTRTTRPRAACPSSPRCALGTGRTARSCCCPTERTRTRSSSRPAARRSSCGPHALSTVTRRGMSTSTRSWPCCSRAARTTRPSTSRGSRRSHTRARRATCRPWRPCWLLAPTSTFATRTATRPGRSPCGTATGEYPPCCCPAGKRRRPKAGRADREAAALRSFTALPCAGSI